MVFTFTLILIAASSVPQATAAVTCNETHNPCEELLWKGSQCRDGFCTNPFQGGCLRAVLDTEEYKEKFSNLDDSITTRSMQSLRQRVLNKPRVCNSEDEPNVAEQGLCVVSENEYPEVRLYGQNWESAFVVSWIMQIIYSELLGVPATMESGAAEANINFYDGKNRMEYGTGNDASPIQNAHKAEGGDCATYKNSVETLCIT